jgi:23S rRNA (guanosine2251-2'-O)-methyltransferase
MRKISNEELNRLSAEEFKGVNKSPIYIILDDVRSLNNIGSVFRTSDAFRIKKIFLCGITATPPHRDIQKTALGATETVDWEYRKDLAELVKELKVTGNKVYAIEQAENSIMLDEFSCNDILENQNIALIFGNEVKGVAQEAINECDGVIEIPQYGTKHSLNIAVSVGIVIWDVFQKTRHLVSK